MSPGIKLGGRIAALDRPFWLETVECGKAQAKAIAAAYEAIVRRERMPLDIKVRPAYNRGCYALWAIPRKAA